MFRFDDFHLAKLEDKIYDTVQTYVRNHVPRPFGILLSGGFDSGFLAAITKPDFVFTVRFEEGIAYDESRFADAIIEHLHLRSKTNVIQITKDSFGFHAPDAIRAMGEPVPHFSLVPLYMVMKHVKKVTKDLGIEANILSGEGPDEYLGGYARQIIFDEMNKLYTIPELRGYHGMVDKTLGVIQQDRLIYKYIELLGYDKKKVEQWFTDTGVQYQYPLQGLIGKLDMEFGVIEKMEQKLAESVGIKLHYPYINDEFAEYCYKLPDRLKIRNGVTKWAFRQIAMKYLPEVMRNRSKMGGPVAPVNEWLFNQKGYDKAEWMRYQKGILDDSR